MSKGRDKRLIITGDDFGLHNSINASIEKAHKEGILTSASLIVTGGGFEDAVRIAKNNRDLGVGIHLTLNGERPASAPNQIPSIVDIGGKLYEDHKKLFIDILRKKASLREVALECEAQIIKFLKTGLVPTHADSHRYIHLFPPIFRAISPVLKKYGIKKIRSLNIPLFDYDMMAVIKTGFVFFATPQREVNRQGFKTPDYYLGYFKSGHMDINYLKGVIPRLKSGVTEISFHPGLDNCEIGEQYGFWKGHYGWPCDWKREYDLLSNREIKELIIQSGVSLKNFSDI